MDTEIEKAIMSEALSAFSKPLVNAKKELNTIRKMLQDPKTKANDVAALKSKLAYITRQFDLARVSQVELKQAKVESLQQTYTRLEAGDIDRALDKGIAFYEDEYMSSLLKKGPILGHYATEQVSLTIPAVYPKPLKSDMAVLLVYFNACSYINLERNLKLTYQSLINSEIPVFLVEHLFKDQEPLFPENGTTIFNTRSDSYMFYKENLLNWLIPKIPAQYTKFYTMDCDLIFDNARWYDEVSALLDTNDIVQPFQDAIWLRSDLKTVDLKKVSIIYGNNLEENVKLSLQHPGFAWAFRREFIEPIGIFDLNVLGSGDTILGTCIIKNMSLYNIFNKYLTILTPYYHKYSALLINAKYTYYSQNVYHLWHGNQMNRWNNKNRYEQFQQECINNNITTSEELFELNSYGLYEYKAAIREEFNTILLDYFMSRDEDGI